MLTIYSKNNCSYCTQAKEFLNKRHIAFTEIKIDEDKDAMDFIKQEGHRTVPQIYEGSKVFAVGGFIGLLNVDPARLDALEKDMHYAS